MKNLFLLITLLSPMPIWADVVTNTHCAITTGGGGPSVSATDPSSCSVTLAPSEPSIGVGKSSASISYSISPSSTPASFFSAGLSASVQPFPATELPPGEGKPQSAEADASGIISLALASSGPVRSGFVEFSEVETITSGQDGVGVLTGVNLGPLSNLCTGYGQYIPLSCTGSLGPPTGSTALMPFTLGQQFAFTEMITANGSSLGELAELAYGTGDLNFQFSLLEADGVTPVQISVIAAPEPSPPMALLIAFPILFFVKTKFPKTASVLRPMDNPNLLGLSRKLSFACWTRSSATDRSL